MTEKHLVVLVHGINTFADWMPGLKKTLEAEGFEVAATSYGRMRVSEFLLPIRRIRERAVKRVVAEIRTAIDLHDPDMISVITHSFGTYVVAQILKNEPRHWHRVIFCGSVVRDDFPFGDVVDRFDFPLINEVGTRDFWPALAESVTWGFGAIGSHGLNHPAVTTRWHAGFRHGDFLTTDFCRDYWVPFLRDGLIKEAGQPGKLPWPIRFATILPLRWFYPLVAVAIALLVWHWYLIPGYAVNVNLRSFGGNPRLTVGLNRNATVQDLLNTVYNLINSTDRVHEFKYGEEWILADENGHLLPHLGTSFVMRCRGRNTDDRPLKDVIPAASNLSALSCNRATHALAADCPALTCSSD